MKTTRSLRNIMLAFVATTVLAAQPAVVSHAAGQLGSKVAATIDHTLKAPTPSCGSTVSINRINGNEIRVRGTGLGQFMLSGVDYGVSTTYEESGQGYGAYNVSRLAGMDYTFTSSGSTTQQFRVVVAASDSSTSYCAVYLFA